MQKIKITIGDRIYPLSVTEGQEAFLRSSARTRREFGLLAVFVRLQT